MTCIVGLEHEGKVYIGGDSLGVSGYNIRERLDEKVFKNGKFIMGFTSSFRMGQLLRYELEPPKLKKGQDVMQFMVKDFVGAVRDCLKVGGYSTISSNEESAGTFLVGFQGCLFCVENDYQVARLSDGEYSVGCGEQYAMGSLYSTSGVGPVRRITEALNAASKYSGGVGGKYTILHN